MSELSPYFGNAGLYFDVEKLEIASATGMGLAQQFEAGNSEGLPDSALTFLREHAEGVGSPNIGLFREMLALHISNEPTPYGTEFVTRLGSTIRGLIDLSNEHAVHLGLADIEATAIWSRGDTPPNNDL